MWALKLVKSVFIFAAFILIATYPIFDAKAGCGCTGCIPGDTSIAGNTIQQRMNSGVNTEIKPHIDDEFEGHQRWLVNDFYQNNVRPALQAFTRQMSAVAMQQVMMVGTFFDAKQQLETQRLYQELQVEAHKDYQPSQSFCTFGTSVRSLAASEQISNLNVQALNSRQMQRHLGNANLAAAVSDDVDKAARWRQFKTTYCNVQDNNFLEDQPAETGLSKVCESGSGTATDEDLIRKNIDIDYTRAVDQPRTLDVVFTDQDKTPTEQDILALGNNLFGHNVITRKYKDVDLTNFENQKIYFALRSVAAKRNVAEHSFNSIVGLKSKGSHTSSDEELKTREFLGAVIKELGVTDDEEIFALIGEDPSYYAQLEILAKKLYQSPDFFAGLYDKPVNVKRKSVALKAIELMLDRAIYESQTRQEMAMSVLLSSQLENDFDTVKADLEGARE